MEKDWSKIDAGILLNDRYRLLEKLGSGGMGAVYAAEDTKLHGKLRAVKVTAASASWNGSQQSSNAEEAWMLARLNHPNLPLIVDCFTIPEWHADVIIMDYIQGETVKRRFERNGQRLPFSEVLDIAIQLGSALSYLHRQTPQIIHRDLKPTNVMLEENGHVRLIDFGIARQFKNGSTQDTALLGTPGFNAPEQASPNGQSGPRTDIYGLGAMLYYLLSGGTYFPSGRHVSRLDPMMQLQPDVPAAFKSLLGKMTQEKEENRPLSMSEVEAALIRLRTDDYDQDRGSLPHFYSVLQSPMTQSNRQVRAAFVSLSPGAGATFASITTAKLLAGKGIAVTAVEFPSAQPEWLTLLDVGTKQQANEKSGGFMEWHTGPVRWLAQRGPFFQAQHGELERQLWQEAETGITLLDMGSLTGIGEVEGWRLLESCQFVYVVADPYPSRWSNETLQRLYRLKVELEARGDKLLWLANKSVRFNRRLEWIAMLPDNPQAVIPLLPQERWLQVLWSGRWATEDTALRKPLEKALKPVLSGLERVLHTTQKKSVL
ncbi:serine/threonine-protein kinase [Paenibacillus gorillae]|uniref:serine/threonine-protein kinase n=1 Tax=Paenibacillus gorillae TaxID=1243662 RepID=UPI0004B55542|nr:serine/threonine-protein kinase [Paenibacillus gorillae]